LLHDAASAAATSSAAAASVAELRRRLLLLSLTRRERTQDATNSAMLTQRMMDVLPFSVQANLKKFAT
jgi:hypothetical protein